MQYINFIDGKHAGLRKADPIRDAQLGLEVCLGDVLHHGYENGPYVYVVVVSNPAFDAAGIIDSPSEFKMVTDPREYRPQTFFLCEKESLLRRVS